MYLPKLLCVLGRERKWITTACTVLVPVIVAISEMQITTQQYDLLCAFVDWTPHQALKVNSKKRWKHHPPAKISPQSEKNNPCHLSCRKHFVCLEEDLWSDRKEAGSFVFLDTGCFAIHHICYWKATLLAQSEVRQVRVVNRFFDSKFKWLL